jgi:hypothetical protein
LILGKKMKSCSRCKVEKELPEFSRRKEKYKARCKACDADYQRERIKRIKEEGGEAYQKYLASHTKYRLQHEDYQREYRARVKEENGQLYQTSLEGRRMYRRRLQEEGGDAYRNYLEVKKNTQRRNLEENPLVRFGITMRTSLRHKLKQSKSDVQYLGTPVTLIKAWLETNFQEDMTWENYGSYWHIDHTLPLSAWNLEDEDECILCFGWHNILPLTKMQNLRKASKILPYTVFHLERQLRLFYSAQKLDTNTLLAFLQQYCIVFKKSCDTFKLREPPKAQTTI